MWVSPRWCLGLRLLVSFFLYLLVSRFLDLLGVQDLVVTVHNRPTFMYFWFFISLSTFSHSRFTYSKYFPKLHTLVMFVHPVATLI